MQKTTTIKNTAALLLLLLALAFDTTAQQTAAHPPGYIFTNYTASDGLSSSEIISLATDKKGFLWTGTMAGLSRYDGYTFTNFTYSADQHLIGVVNTVINDTADRLWIGASSGLYCYSQNRLARISTVTNKQISVNGIVAQANGDLWLATDKGPAFIKANDIDITGAKKLQLQNFVVPGWTEKYASLYGSRCEQIKKAPDGTIYFSQQYQLFRIISGKTELVHTSKEQRDVIEYFFPVSRSKVFYNTSVTGLHKTEDGKHTLFYFKDLYQPARKPRSEGYWYVGSLGLVCFHPDEEFISETIAFRDEGAQWLSSVIKENNILWLGSHSGLIKVKPSVFHLYSEDEYIDVQESFSFYELQQGRFLIGVNHGSIYEFNGQTVKDFLTGDQRPVKYAEIKAMYEDQRGWLWTGTGYQGIAVYRKGTITNFTSEVNNLHDNSFYSFLQTKQGKLYAIGDQGMTEIVIDAKDHISFVPYVSPPTVTQYAKFYDGIEAPDGTVWIAGEEGIRFLQNDSLVPFSLFDKNIPIRDIRKASDGSVWITTSGEGIFCCRFDEKGKLQLVKHYTQKDGLNTLQFLDLLIDKEDNVWAGSIMGLTFIGRNGKYKNMLVNFTEADGFIRPAYYSMKLYQDKKGQVWAGTSLGIASFIPDELFLSALPPKIYITGIDLLKRNDTTANNSILIKENSGPPLTFSWSNSSLNFEYTAIDQAAPEGLHYYYRMDGLDTNWINAGLRRSVTYHNLAPGSYTFSVKAINEKGVWSEGTASFSFIIKPPFWKTWWFILLLIVTVIALAFFLIKQRIAFIKKREAEKTELQKIKTASYQSKLETEQVINYFATSILVQTTIDEMLWDVARNLIGKLGFEDCMIYLWNKDKTVLLQRAGFGLKGSMQNAMDKEIYHVPKGKGIVGAAVESGHYILANDTSLDKRYFSVDEKVRLSELCVPIMHNNEAMGAINTEHSSKNFYTDRHLQVLITIASMLADKIDTIEAQQQTREKEMEVLRLSKDLATSQINTLRAQMNPHFLFNAMNSIQQFTLKNDVDNANLYISRFSTLLRKVLHTSQQKFISLEEEIEQLNLYLDIERLRLGDSFNYDIKVEEEIETEAVKIPGMLIQPFVENALKHGLSPKAGVKKLEISFHLAENDILQVMITDNGIGRLKAQQLKEQQQRLLPYESKGILLVEERLKLISRTPVKEIIQFEDLYDSSGQASGTRLTLSIPLQAASA